MTRPGHRTILAALALLAWSLRAGDAPQNFQTDIRPVLEANCFKCHGPQKQKGGIDFSNIGSDPVSLLRQHKSWRKAVAQIEAGDMPPESETALDAEKRGKLLRFMKQTIEVVDHPDPNSRNPGPALIRRLSRAEYNLTLRDLLGIEFDAGEAVGMTEETGGSFTNLATALTLSPSVMEKYFDAADIILDRLFSKDRKKQLDALLKPLPAKDLSERDAARKVVVRVARQAYRRPVENSEIERLMQFYDKSGEGAKYEQRVRAMLKPLLVSPNFLFRIEQDTAGSQASRVNNHELAARLSYFIWSSMPDAELSVLAGDGKLSDPAVLDAQVKRMLADKKAAALTENFGAQWLQIKKVESARPSTEFFPSFNAKLRKAMYDETATFFDKLREEDRSIAELLDCDYAYLNQDLAKHYNISGIEGEKLRRVALKPENHRGGLLAMGSVLAMTSHTSRTSPTLRGKYVLEVILGTPPPPPPPNAGVLKEETDKKKKPKTFREQMAQHATDATCAGCHKKMDPLGYALENFDAVGAWRDNFAGQPLDNSGELPGGEKFTGPAGLKELLLKRKEQFVRNVAERMFTFALGREADYYDEPALREITVQLDKNNCRFSVLVSEIVKSFPFQYRRNGEEAAAK